MSAMAGRVPEIRRYPSGFPDVDLHAYHVWLIASPRCRLRGDVHSRSAYHRQGLLQSFWENRVRKFAIRLFTLTLCTTALLTVAMVPSVWAAGNGGGEVEKTRKKNQRGGSEDLRSPGLSDARSPTLATWPPPMHDDFDRKVSGGGM